MRLTEKPNSIIKSGYSCNHGEWNWVIKLDFILIKSLNSHFALVGFMGISSTSLAHKKITSLAPSFFLFLIIISHLDVNSQILTDILIKLFLVLQTSFPLHKRENYGATT